MDQEVVFWFLGYVLALAGAVWGMFRWISGRLEKMDERKADAAITDNRFAETIARLDTHIQRDERMHERLGDKIDKTNALLANASVHIASLDGKLHGRRESDRPQQQP